MKCINKVVAGIVATGLFLTGCGQEAEYTYDLYSSSYEYGLLSQSSVDTTAFFADDLCVIGFEDVGDIPVDNQVAEACGVFNTTTSEVLYADDIHQKIYPASTTKILTCYLAIKYADLDQKVSVSARALDIDKDSSVANLKEGDVLTIRQLLYGLMLPSGNDAANVIAEAVSGSIEAFADLMNQEAIAMGAYNSHFVNPHGLSDDDHYTTAYDMYLIFSNAITNDIFNEIIGTDKYIAYYTNKHGETVEQTWKCTNGYINGSVDCPEDITMIGGKTGTTYEAGYCLVGLCRNQALEPVITVVFKADCRSNLYLLSTQLMRNYANL